MIKAYKTQWVGQFAVASELTRRNYLVTLTLGNAPSKDLLCQSPNGKNFSIQVKSLSSKGFFPLQKGLLNEEHPDLYFIFVFVPGKLDLELEFFVLTQRMLKEIWEHEKLVEKEREEKRGKPYAVWADGISYNTLLRNGFKNSWNNLPE